MNEPNIMVLIDTDKIKEYVFATNRLREIRGASAILDRLNLESTYRILQNLSDNGNYCNNNGEWEDNKKTIKDNNIAWEVIFLGGGSGKIFFADKEKARLFCHNIQEKYWSETDNSASITTVVVARKDHERFKDWVYRGEKELRKQKDSRSIRVQALTSQYFKICESSGLWPAEDIGDGDRRLICKSVSYRRSLSKDNRSYFFQFKKWLVEHKDNIKPEWNKIVETDDSEMDKFFPGDLNDIGLMSNGYVGFIYADANRMGQRLSKLEEPDEYKILSKRVKQGVKDALFSALAGYIIPIVSENKSYIPFEVVLLGGDDLMVVVPANKAMEIAINFCDKFREKTDISICAGVVITHSNYPIHRMMDYSQGLLNSAKALSNQEYLEAKQAGESLEVNAVDFMVLKGSVLNNLREIREKEFSYSSDNNIHEDKNDLRLYQRPYTTEQLAELLGWIREFKKSQFPANKLRTMYESLYRGKQQAILDYLFITIRLSDSARNDIAPRKVFRDFRSNWKGGAQIFPWWELGNETFDTPFIDIIELYDFIDYQGGGFIG